jgi:hypothetical protein
MGLPESLQLFDETRVKGHEKKIPPLQLTPHIARSWNLRERFSAAGAELPKSTWPWTG